MTRPFIDPHYTPAETSDRLCFSGNRLDRLSEERDDDCVAQALVDPAARAFGLVRGRVLIAIDGQDPPERFQQGLFEIDRLQAFSPQMDRAILLGFDNSGFEDGHRGAPRLAIPLALDFDEENVVLPDGFKAIDYRSLAAQQLLPHEELGQVAQGAACLAWHRSARYCGYCGAQTKMAGGGVKRVCTACEREIFPRTDPVVIMLIVRGDQCLLGRSAGFPPGVYSALAGFVEAGETIETAVRRETFEESGIRVGKVSYHATQPWPFPHTLMIGCFGEALDTKIIKDDSELEDCRWFSKQQIQAIISGEGPRDKEGNPKFLLPPKLAIANRLVSDWAGGEG